MQSETTHLVLEIPILPNIYGYSCLDYCLTKYVPKHHIDYEIFFKDEK